MSYLYTKKMIGMKAPKRIRCLSCTECMTHILFSYLFIIMQHCLYFKYICVSIWTKPFSKNKMCECAAFTLLFSTALSSPCHSDDADSAVVMTFPHCHANISRSLWPPVSLSPIISTTAWPPSCLRGWPVKNRDKSRESWNLSMYSMWVGRLQVSLH